MNHKPRRATGRHNQPAETDTIEMHQPAFVLSFELDLQQQLNMLKYTVADPDLYSEDFETRWIDKTTKICNAFDRAWTKHLLAEQQKPLVTTVPEADQNTHVIRRAYGELV